MLTIGDEAGKLEQLELWYNYAPPTPNPNKLSLSKQLKLVATESALAARYTLA